MIDSKVGRKETTSDDIDAYDLIMKNKELTFLETLTMAAGFTEGKRY